MGPTAERQGRGARDSRVSPWGRPRAEPEQGRRCGGPGTCLWPGLLLLGVACVGHQTQASNTSPRVPPPCQLFLLCRQGDAVPLPSLCSHVSFWHDGRPAAEAQSMATIHPGPPLTEPPVLAPAEFSPPCLDLWVLFLRFDKEPEAACPMYLRQLARGKAEPLLSPHLQHAIVPGPGIKHATQK